MPRYSIEVTIQNKGEHDVSNISLVDSFFPGTFEAVEPLDEFELKESDMSDPHLFWTKQISSLKPGETKVYAYSVKIRNLGLETRLGALSVLVNGIPVGVSNDIILYSELGEETPKPEPSAKGKFATVYLIIIIGAVALIRIIAGTLAIRRRRKKT